MKPIEQTNHSEEELTKVCRGLLQRLSERELASEIQVRWNSRMRSSAGRATWPVGLIELNPRLQEISPNEVKRTLLHELAHLLAYHRHGNRRIQAHGAEWQRACADLGIPGERATHSLALPSRKLKRHWQYRCPSCGVSIERVRRFKGRVACYSCCKDSGGGYQDQFRLEESRLG